MSVPTTPLRRPRGLEYHPAVATAHLAAADPGMAAIIARVGPFTMRPDHSLEIFDSLARSIVYQQLSGIAAGTIYRRFREIYPDPARPPTPAELAATPDARLRAAGLSTAKTAALKDLARHALAGTVPTVAAARRLSDEELIERLTAVRGVGRWTVEMLLIFRLGRPDVLPVTDLGVRKGFMRLYRMRSLPAVVTLTRRAERWRPYRSVASWYLWRAAEEPTG